MMKGADDERGDGLQNSYLTVIVVHSTMHLMHHNHCQITSIKFIGWYNCIKRQSTTSTKMNMCVCVCVYEHTHTHVHLQYG